MNKNRVNKRVWSRWSPVAQRVFNETYSWMFKHQEFATHPKQVKIPKEQWKTVAWNSAWIAADAVDDEIPTEVITQ